MCSIGFRMQQGLILNEQTKKTKQNPKSLRAIKIIADDI